MRRSSSLRVGGRTGGLRAEPLVAGSPFRDHGAAAGFPDDELPVHAFRRAGADSS